MRTHWSKTLGLGIRAWGLGVRAWGLGIRAWGLALVALLGVCAVPGAAQQYSFEEVASGLKAKDAATRLRAIQILRDADFAEAAVPIAAALEDPDDSVQLAAIEAERTLFTTRPVSRRRKVGFVVEVRSIAGNDVSAEGQLALKARLVPRQVLSSLVIALRDGTPRVRAEAISLASLLAPSACMFGESTVRSRESTVESPGPRVEVGDACRQVGDAVVDNINSREAALRRAAMQTLGQLRYPHAVQALSDQLSYYQRGADAEAAFEGLAGIGHPTSVSLFRRELASTIADMRRLAVEGLARSGSAEALPELQQMGQSERSNGVLLALHYASLKLGAPGSDARPLIAALRDAPLRPLALKYLLDLAPSIAPALVDSLSDPSADVRRLVADVMGFSRDARVVPALEAATKDPEAAVAAAAQRALDRLKLALDRPSLDAGG